MSEKSLAARQENIKSMIASVVLHNFLRVRSGKPAQQTFFENEDIENGQIHPGDYEVKPPNGFENLQPVARGHPNEAKSVRKYEELFHQQI